MFQQLRQTIEGHNILHMRRILYGFSWNLSESFFCEFEVMLADYLKPKPGIC